MSNEATTLGEFVRELAVRCDQPLARFDDATLTYAQAHADSDRFAAGLAGLGVQPGDRVTTLLYNGPEQILVWFACAKLGAVWVPLNVSLVGPDLGYALADSKPRVAIVADELRAGYDSVAPPDVIAVSADGFSADQSTVDAVVRPGDPVCIVYTGGSTGRPKGVVLSHGYFLEMGRRYRTVTGGTPDDVHFAAGHLFHSGGQQLGLIGPMTCGMTTVFRRWFSASGFWPRAREVGATIIDVQGTMIAAIMRQPEASSDVDNRVRIGVGVGAGQIPIGTRIGFERRFGVMLLEGYAQTETGILLCSETPTDRRGSSGTALGWADVRIADDDDETVPAGATGHILVRPTTPHGFMLRYVKAEETVAAWRHLWYHTGDLGYVDADGYLYFVGRQAHWIRHRGENFSAFEVESVVSGHPYVVDCAAVGVPGDLGDEDVKVYVQVDPQARDRFEPAGLIDWCTGRLAYFKLPRFVEVVDELPRTTTKQEIERHVLRERGIGSAWDAQAVLGLGTAGHRRQPVPGGST